MPTTEVNAIRITEVGMAILRSAWHSSTSTMYSIMSTPTPVMDATVIDPVRPTMKPALWSKARSCGVMPW